MNIFLDMVGCRLNQSEIEKFALQFRTAGHTIVAKASEADMVVVNTCAVTAEAASDSRQKIRQAARAGSQDIIVTGCWSTLNQCDAQNLPNVRQVIPNHRKDHLVKDVLHLPDDWFEAEPLARQPLPGIRQRTRAFIKVQDGCNNRCTFCLTSIARGESLSRSVAEVIQDIQNSLQGGTKEIVLTGVHLGSWGKDLSPNLHLEDLIRAILRETEVLRLRLSSLEPWDLKPSFFEIWQDPRMCPHLHLPLQSGSGTILRRMARKVTPESYAMLVEMARKVIPGIAITTDVIAGFPGEGTIEFEESLNYIRSMKFAGGHAFTYSARPGTAAEKFPDQVPLPIKKIRNAQIREIFAKSAREYAIGFAGQIHEVLWESIDGYSPQGWQMNGLTKNDLRVMAFAARPSWNEVQPVKLIQYINGKFYGECGSTVQD